MGRDLPAGLAGFVNSDSAQVWALRTDGTPFLLDRHGGTESVRRHAAAGELRCPVTGCADPAFTLVAGSVVRHHFRHRGGGGGSAHGPRPSCTCKDCYRQRQNERKRAERQAQAARDRHPPPLPGATECVWCGGPVVQSGQGRPRQYCTRQHAVAAADARKGARENLSAQLEGPALSS